MMCCPIYTNIHASEGLHFVYVASVSCLRVEILGDTHAKCDFSMFPMTKCEPEREYFYLYKCASVKPICMTVTTVQAVGGRVLSVLSTTRGTSLKLGYAKAHAHLKHIHMQIHSLHTLNVILQVAK